MEIFDLIQSREHEQLIFCSDEKAGLRAIIGIHDTTLGPALGGTRMWTYASDMEALKDVLRLSRGMTYKAAVAGLNLGGGKAVIIGDPRKQKTEALFRTYGRFVEGIGGRYITAEDVGTSVQDMEWIHMETKYVTGVAGRGGSGDPSPFTAYGVYHGIKACAKFQYGNDSLAGKNIAIQGAGNVAQHVAEHLANEGAKLTITDIYEDKARRICDATGATYVEPEAIYDVECDIFSPSALGAIINDDTISRLKCSIVAGGANNQLAKEDVHAQALADRGILYAPDYVINAGGLMNVASEIDGYDKNRVLTKAEGIYDILLNIFKKAQDNNILPHEASNAIAEERIEAVRRVKKHHVGTTHIARL